MVGNEKDGYLPSYAESINTAPSGHSQSSRVTTPSRGQQLLNNLTVVRAQHIRSVIDDVIIPFVEQQAQHGTAQTTIAMIPSDVNLPVEEEKSEFSFDTGNEKKVEVIGFSSDESPQIVRLEGQMNRTEFWRPQAIVQELERVLKESLNALPHLRSPTSPRFSPTQQEIAQKQPRRSFFGRVADVFNQEERSPSGNTDIGVRPPESGQVLVKARLEEICLRTVNEFGLYNTMSKQCVTIQVDARC